MQCVRVVVAVCVMTASYMQRASIECMLCVMIRVLCNDCIPNVNRDFKPELESSENIDTVIGGMPSDDQQKATTVTVFAEVAVQTDAGRWT